MRLPRFARYQILVHIAALAPLAWLLFDALAGNLSVNPIQDIEQRTGKYALIMLALSLWCTPANIVTGWAPVTQWRRPLGLYAFMYAALHFVTFIGLDYGFQLSFILADIANKRYIFVGLAALLMLIPLVLTSTRGWQRRLRKGWARLHRLVYVVGVLVVIHYVWAVKADIRGPLLWGIAIGLGFAIRLPSIRSYFVRGRGPRVREGRKPEQPAIARQK